MSTSTAEPDTIQRLNRAAEGLPEGIVGAAIQMLEAVKGKSIQQAYTTRALAVMTAMVEAANEETLLEAVGQPFDFEVLLKMLEQPGILARMREYDPLVPARIRGLRLRNQVIMAEGGLWTATQVAAFLNMTRQGVDYRRKEGKLIGVLIGKHRYEYPAWQFGPQGVLPGLADVFAELREYDPWMKAIFMLTPNATLGDERPLDVLQRGDIAAVRRAAARFAVQSAT